MKKLLLLGALLTSFNVQAVESDWEYHSSADEITDEKAYYTLKVIKESLGLEFLFAIHCQNEKFKLGINPDYFESDGEATTIFRIDKEQPYRIDGYFQKNMWFVLDQDDIKKITDDLKRGNKVTVRLKGKHDSVTKSVSLSGFTRAYNKMEEECRK